MSTEGYDNPALGQLSEAALMIIWLSRLFILTLSALLALSAPSPKAFASISGEVAGLNENTPVELPGYLCP